jgi:hypothetical protein
MPWSLPRLDADRIADAAAVAARRHGVECGLVQDCLKPTTLLMLDGLLGEVLPEEPERLWLAVNNMQKDQSRIGASKQSRVAVEPYEVLVDFHYFAGMRTPYRTVLTAESEGYAPAVRHLARLPLPKFDEDWSNNGLLWDMWKLVIVPSPMRIFTTVASEQQFTSIAAHFGALLARYTDVGHAGSPFALVCFDPEGVPAPSVRTSLWHSGAWKAVPDVATRALARA